MKVLLVGPDFGEYRLNLNIIMSLSLYQVAGILRNSGCDISVIDPSLFNGAYYDTKLADELREKASEADMVAFSVNSFNTARVYNMIKMVKESNKNAYILVGGLHATKYYNQFLTHFKDVDFLVRGEGEVSLPKLIECLENNGNFANVPNLVYRHSNSEDIMINSTVPNISLDETVAFPTYDLVPEAAYHYVSIESSRGCVGGCSFCSILGQKCWRFYKAETVIERIEKAVAMLTFECNGLCFTDDCFTTDAKRAVNILEYLAGGKLAKKSIFIEARIRDLINDELLQALTRLPGINIQVGVECGYDEGLEQIGKNIVVSDVETCALKLKEYGLANNALFSFIVGFPWETKKECLDTMNTAARMNKKYGVNVNCAWWIPLPSRLLSSVDNDNNNTFKIYMDEKWLNSQTVFDEFHPNISIATFTEIISVARMYFEYQGIKLFN